MQPLSILVDESGRMQPWSIRFIFQMVIEIARTYFLVEILKPQ